MTMISYRDPASLLVWDHWHIEISSICALKCPRCPRAEIPEDLLNQQLTLQFFQQQIGTDIVRQIRKITFCGNDGDPIYGRDLIEIIGWIKSVNPDIHLVIITNGSHRPKKWWQKLASVLDHRDEIHWSIDGWDQNSNALYRVRSDWNSIQDGIAAFSAVNHDTYRVWAAIAFKFNQHHLKHMRHMAEHVGMDLWQLTKSTKFGSHYPQTYGLHDPLCPDDPELVSSSQRFERVLETITQRTRPGEPLKIIFLQRGQILDQQNLYSAICMIGNKGVFVNSQGEFFPCCWTATRYPHNQQWHDLARDRFNLWLRSFTDIISDPYWTTDFLRFDSQECQTKCTKDQLKNQEHISEW